MFLSSFLREAPLFELLKIWMVDTASTSQPSSQPSNAPAAKSVATLWQCALTAPFPPNRCCCSGSIKNCACVQRRVRSTNNYLRHSPLVKCVSNVHRVVHGQALPDHKVNGRLAIHSHVPAIRGTDDFDSCCANVHSHDDGNPRYGISKATHVKITPHEMINLRISSTSMMPVSSQYSNACAYGKTVPLSNISSMPFRSVR